MNFVRRWLGWPEWSVLIGQTLVIGVTYVSSTNLGFQIDLEDILGIVAITTFLVGFSSVRLQSILEEQKDVVARRVDRVLEQNAGQDLLPLPTSLGQMGATDQRGFIDEITGFTIGLTWLNFIIAFVLIIDYQDNSDSLADPFWLVQIVHFLIVLIGSGSPTFVRKQFRDYKKDQPFECFERMMTEIRKHLDEPKQVTKQLQTTIEDFDASVPEWSWLTLVRCSLLHDNNRPQLNRIYDLVKLQKDEDDYSLVAFVWSAYLLDNGQDDSISRTVKYSDIEKILHFGSANATNNKEDQSVYGSKSLENKADQKLVVVKDFISSFNVLCDKDGNLGDPTKQGQMQAQIFVQMAVREIARVWSATK